MDNKTLSGKHVVLTGGGTAGHITPNFALVQELNSKKCKISYIGLKNGMEEGLVEREGLNFYGISGGKLRRNFKWANITDLGRIAKGFAQSLLLLKKLKPDLVFSKGGYVTAPVVWAAWCLKIPILLHESDLTPGLANRLSMPFATAVAYAFKETAQFLPKSKAHYTGLPIREALLKGDRNKALTATGLNGSKPIILVTGGSQGARSINHLIHLNLIDLLEKFEICHLVGKGNVESALAHQKGYHQIEYVTEGMGDLYTMADYVISRAGATTIFELLALKKPHILIPLGSKATRGDQIVNAQSFETSGYSLVLEDRPDISLIEALEILEENASQYVKNMNSVSEDASKAVVDLMEKLI